MYIFNHIKEDPYFYIPLIIIPALFAGMLQYLGCDSTIMGYVVFGIFLVNIRATMLRKKYLLKRKNK